MTARQFSRVSFAALAAGLALLAQPAAPTLTIDSFGFREFEGGPPLRRTSLMPGDLAHIEFRVAGFKRIEGDFDDKMSIGYSIQALDAKGVALAKEQTGKIEQDVTPEDLKTGWRPKVTASFPVPLYLAPGEYAIRVRLTDAVGKAAKEATFPFRTGGGVIPSAASIVAYNVRFLRQEEDTNPLANPVYRSGDTLWLRFEMTGFRTAAENEIALRYGFQVRSGGKLLFEQPPGTEERRKFFYPPAYMPGAFSLEIKPGTRLGRYELVVMVEDLIANQRSESVHSFEIQ